MRETILAVVNALGDISVSGKHNLELLLGCIRTLEQLAVKEADDVQHPAE